MSTGLRAIFGAAAYLLKPISPRELVTASSALVLQCRPFWAVRTTSGIREVTGSLLRVIIAYVAIMSGSSKSVSINFCFSVEALLIA